VRSRLLSHNKRIGIVKKSNKPNKVDLTIEESEALIIRIENNTLTDADRKLCVQMLRFMFWLQSCLLEAKLSIKRLKNIFGIKTEKK
jgi:hypothetical protein